jgi:hypothetical protein
MTVDGEQIATRSRQIVRVTIDCKSLAQVG